MEIKSLISRETKYPPFELKEKFLRYSKIKKKKIKKMMLLKHYVKIFCSIEKLF